MFICVLINREHDIAYNDLQMYKKLPKLFIIWSFCDFTKNAVHYENN